MVSVMEYGFSCLRTSCNTQSMLKMNPSEWYENLARGSFLKIPAFARSGFQEVCLKF